MLAEPIYKLRPADVFPALETSPDGLSVQNIQERQVLYGRNILTVEPPEPLWKPLLRQMAHASAVLLWAAGGIALVSGDRVLALAIWGLVLLNAGLSFWRERRAVQSINALRDLMPVYARVLREGVEASLPANEIVPGDVIILAEGDQIPADGRVVESSGLRINSAALTGESVPVLKTADASLHEDIGELERPNLVFAGTSVYSGTGKAVIFATGMLTQFGRIARLAQNVPEAPSLLHAELERMARRMSWVSAGIAAMVWIAGATDIKLGTQEAFVLALGVLAALTPEGLPANLTLALATAGHRLAKQGVLVKKLSAIETLGTVSTICTDKSGTLTQNQMTVQEITTGSQGYRVTGVGYAPQGQILPLEKGSPLPADLGLLLAAAILCNNARLSPPAAGHPVWTCLGDQTEAALRVAALKGGLEDSSLQKILPRIHELPFDACRKRMTTIHRFQAGDQLAKSLENGVNILQESQQPEVAFVKGAPRELLQQCTHLLDGSAIRPLSASDRQAIFRQIDEKARRALRVLALAYRPLPARSGLYTAEKVENDLVFLGLTAMMDPPRPEVAQAVQTCQQAGIRMIMVTGDYGLTAESVARRLGMLATHAPKIITGVEVELMQDHQLQQTLAEETIFARMAPEHKLRLVAALQQQGEVVAVIGDGVNDAPALRRADLGVCMGITGTDVAKEAADVILVRDDFASIIPAIAEGRTIYKNLRKVITYILSSNVAEIAPVLLSTLFDVPLLLSVRQILAIDLLTDMLPSLALGTEKPEPDVMQSPPYRKGRPLLNRSIFRRAFLWLGPIETLLALSGALLIYTNGAIIIPDYLAFLEVARFGIMHLLTSQWFPDAPTIYFAGVVIAQAGNALACRTEVNRSRALGWLSNRFLWFSVAISSIVLVGLIYIPWLAGLFNVVPIPMTVWLWLLPYPLLLYSLEWLRKSTVRFLWKNRR